MTRLLSRPIPDIIFICGLMCAAGSKICGLNLRVRGLGLRIQAWVCGFGVGEVSSQGLIAGIRMIPGRRTAQCVFFSHFCGGCCISALNM